MRTMSFPGRYEDEHGVEPLQWQLVPSTRAGWHGRFEIRTEVRGQTVAGGDFDALEIDAAVAQEKALVTDAYDTLTGCLLSGDLPCTLATGGARVAGTVHFALDLRTHGQEALELSVDVQGEMFRVTDEWFEDGLLRLSAALPHGTELVCCITCLYSDYRPGGHGLTGMSCHREAKVQYLAVRSKADYWGVPVTEDVPEFYLCPDYQRRVPGTGYRG